MLSNSARFDAICEPLGRWLVWDRVADQPAEFNGLALIGLARTEARSLCGLLNFAPAAVGSA